MPQDGHIDFVTSRGPVDLRVSTVPTVYGESVVMRILDRATALIGLERLGLPEPQLTHFKQQLESPHGIVLVTGPTGSGKSTTLYAALNHLFKPELKILTIEDPVEYRIDGINQIPVNPKRGLTFADGLRSILRQDPDVIMVGEVRDGETADIAIPLGAHRPPGVLDAAHQRLDRRGGPADRHGRRAVPHRLVAACGDGPAAGAPAVPALQA